ncbi:hypothetical protein GGR54DRAFT_638486 [Hypoxylon sp. NC1633]|nr:hypothetical protein GGR54DRAFT_638486 [Hypoxylon sp. NC1633]
MDWLIPLQNFGTSYLYPALKLILKLCYILTIPLHYPIYYLLALVIFLLSPIWHTLRAISSAALAVAGLLAKLKNIYVYLACAAIVGICAGAMLHGTSSFIFVSLGVDASQKQESPLLIDEDQDLYDTGYGTRSEDSSSRLSASGVTSRRGNSKQDPNDDAYDMFEKQWKLVRSPEKPRRRRRGLLAQTIHEESSSDAS